MAEQEKLYELLQKLEQLQKKQTEYSKELFELRKEINSLKASPQQTLMPPVAEKSTEATVKEEVKTTQPKPVIKAEQAAVEKVFTEKPKQQNPVVRTKEVKKEKSYDLEKFIGENLISKIGILITIIGVAIGAKYTIEHNLMSPLTRIILGYCTGIGLLVFGMKLKKNYESYSAVLVSGAMTIMYFITFAAYSFYGLIPQLMAFVLMLVFTVFTVVAALNYKQQIIAQLGLVGAYAVPFLLSDGSGRAEVLFTYVGIINIGILFVSFKKYWRSLFYSSFFITWLIYGSWFVFSYRFANHFGIAFTFITVTFLTFYVTYLAYKLIQKKEYSLGDIILLLMNAFIYFGLGYALLLDHKVGKELLGLFALLNAVIHFVVSVIIYRQKLADKNLFYLVSGLVLVFLTIAVPIQLDGHWVTLIWAGEAALLFWIGRSRGVGIYENLSYPVMVLAFLSLVQDWSSAYGRYYGQEEVIFRTLLNTNFMSSAIFIVAFSFITYWTFKKKEDEELNGLLDLAKIAVPAILIGVTYAAFALELNEFWSIEVYNARNTNVLDYVESVKSFKNVWLVNYTLGFLALLSVFNLFKLKNKNLGGVNLALNAIAIFAFLVVGLYEYSELREYYIAYSGTNSLHLSIRYISMLFAGVLIYLTHLYNKRMFPDKQITMLFELLFHIIIVWVLSSELLHWMDLGETDKNYKLGLSILWGVYSLMLVVIGIWKHKKHLRVGGMVLFGVTLLKLFFYDLNHLNTISKTIVFVSLGVLLLIISFLYNKYSNLINNEKED